MMKRTAPPAPVEAVRQLAVGRCVYHPHADALHAFTRLDLVVGIAVVAHQHVDRLWDDHGRCGRRAVLRLGEQLNRQGVAAGGQAPPPPIEDTGADVGGVAAWQVSE